MESPPGIIRWILTPHAEERLRRRKIARHLVAETIAHPEQRYAVRPGREGLQRRFRLAGGARDSLLRVFVDTDRIPAEVVSVYLTSKIAKYWRRNP